MILANSTKHFKAEFILEVFPKILINLVFQLMNETNIYQLILSEFSFMFFRFSYIASISIIGGYNIVIFEDI